jgi:hypothetical protein
MIRCRFGFHAYTERDEHGRITCERCGRRKPVVFATIPDPDLVGRQLTRPKTRGQKWLH